MIRAGKVAIGVTVVFAMGLFYALGIVRGWYGQVEDAGTIEAGRIPDAVRAARDAGQCRDCFLPAFKYRPAGSAQ